MNNVLAASAILFNEPTAEKWAAAKAAGLVDTELILPGRAPSLEAILEKGEAEHAMLTCAGMAISSTHLPFGPAWDISSTDETLRSKAIADYKTLLTWAGKKGIGIAVLHPSFEPIDPATRAQQLEYSAASIAEISAFAREQGVRIAVENLPRSCLGNCAADMLALTQNGKTASICFDSNHLLIETHAEFLPQIAPYVITTHLSDYDRINERHWLPGEGIIDWPLVVRLLSEANYNGRFLFEVHENCIPSSERLITPAELVERFRLLV